MSALANGGFMCSGGISGGARIRLLSEPTCCIEISIPALWFTMSAGTEAHATGNGAQDRAVQCVRFLQ